MFKVLVFIFAIIHCVAYSSEVTQPTDVQQFMDRRDDCDHFRGEPIYSKAREETILQAMRERCTGTDAQLNALKIKYFNNISVISALSIYDENIE